jgi:predicted PurR-regulated permease PerM
MRKQSNLITILTLICSVCSLILSLMAFIRADNTATVVDLRNQNIQLQSQIDKLSNRLGSATESSTYAISDAYCNLLVESFREEGVNLILDKGYVQLQMPQATTDCLTVRRAELVLMMDGSEMYQQDITLQEGEGEGGYETVLKNVSLPLPEMTEENQLDLVVEVTFSDGQSLRSPSASWYVEDGRLLLVAG